MLTRIFTKTRGDWNAIEVDGERKFRLGGPTQIALRSEQGNRLDNAEINTRLIDSKTGIGDSFSGTIHGMIDRFVYNQEKDAYTPQTKDGVTHDDVTFTPDEVKTMLYAEPQ